MGQEKYLGLKILDQKQGQMLPGPMSRRNLWSVQDGPRYLILNFGQNHMRIWVFGNVVLKSPR